MEEKIRILQEIARLCGERGEIDGALLAPYVGYTPVQAQKALEKLDGEGLISTVEYGFSCSVEIMAEGLTPEGERLLRERDLMQF